MYMPIDVALIEGQRLFVARHLSEEIHGIPEKKNQTGEGTEGICRNLEEIANGISKHGISRGDQEKIMWNFQESWF